MLDFSSLSPSCFSSFSLWFFGLHSPLLKPKTHFLKPKILCGGGSDEGRRGRGLSSIVVAWVSLFVSLFIFLSFSLISRPFLSLSPLFYLFFSLYLPLNQPSMVEMRCGIHGSVAGFHHPWCGFHFWRYVFHGSRDEFHFWWCGWLNFFVP